MPLPRRDRVDVFRSRNRMKRVGMARVATRCVETRWHDEYASGGRDPLTPAERSGCRATPTALTHLEVLVGTVLNASSDSDAGLTRQDLRGCGRRAV
jgi:hypothetical protein